METKLVYYHQGIQIGKTCVFSFTTICMVQELGHLMCMSRYISTQYFNSSFFFTYYQTFLKNLSQLSCKREDYSHSGGNVIVIPVKPHLQFEFTLQVDLKKKNHFFGNTICFFL